MKKLKITLILVLLVVTSSCGFKPMNLAGNKTVNFKNINISGDKKISYNLRNNILLISSNDSKNVRDLDIKLQKKKK